ncbi:MAG: ABC transporter ATP-binding protein [Anaerolineae bacterium]|nr:ABC transporter ATP-binding protein [Anaerolineae bacterium]
MIELQNVTRIYKMGSEEIHALDHVDLSIGDGEFVAVTGPSGSGKSTLLHVIGGLDTPTAGSVIVDGQDLAQATDRDLARFRNRRIGFVFQTFNLQPTYTAVENVALPLVFAGVPPHDRQARARQALDAVGLGERQRHRPAEMSGGERQRVAIARALVTEPAYILADEPTGNLDTATGQEIVALLDRLHRERALTILLVTHDREIATLAARQIALRDGRIVAREARQ